MSFGQQLKKIRKERSLSKQTLGKMVGVSRESIAKYEADEREPSLSRARDLAYALNVSLLTLAEAPDFEYICLNTLSEKCRDDVIFIINKEYKK